MKLLIETLFFMCIISKKKNDLFDSMKTLRIFQLLAKWAAILFHAIVCETDMSCRPVILYSKLIIGKLFKLK